MLPIIIIAAGALALVASSGKKSSDSNEETGLQGIRAQLATLDILEKEGPAPRGSTKTRGPSGPSKSAKRLLPNIKKVDWGKKIKRGKGMSSKFRPNARKMLRRGPCNPPNVAMPYIIRQLESIDVSVTANRVPVPRKRASVRRIDRGVKKAVQAKMLKLNRT